MRAVHWVQHNTMHYSTDEDSTLSTAQYNALLNRWEQCTEFSTMQCITQQMRTVHWVQHNTMHLQQMITVHWVQHNTTHYSTDEDSTLSTAQCNALLNRWGQYTEYSTIQCITQQMRTEHWVQHNTMHFSTDENSTLRTAQYNALLNRWGQYTESSTVQCITK